MRIALDSYRDLDEIVMWLSLNVGLRRSNTAPDDYVGKGWRLKRVKASIAEVIELMARQDWAIYFDVAIDDHIKMFEFALRFS